MIRRPTANPSCTKLSSARAMFSLHLSLNVLLSPFERKSLDNHTFTVESISQHSPQSRTLWNVSTRREFPTRRLKAPLFAFRNYLILLGMWSCSIRDFITADSLEDILKSSQRVTSKPHQIYQHPMFGYSGYVLD